MDGEERLIIGVDLILETSSLLDGVLRADIHCSLPGKRVCSQSSGSMIHVVLNLYVESD
jgi:hypothetical protein